MDRIYKVLATIGCVALCIAFWPLTLLVIFDEQQRTKSGGKP